MDLNTQDSQIQPEAASHLSFKQEFQDASPLDAFLKDAARRMLHLASEEEVQEFLGRHDRSSPLPYIGQVMPQSGQTSGTQVVSGAISTPLISVAS